MRLGRRSHRHKPLVSRLFAGLIGIVVVLAITYGCYTKFGNPFANPYTVHATFANANGVQIGSPVRIGGVDVGKVTGVHALGGGQQAADVTMTIDHAGLPIHQNATFDIRPRIFLEGNFFVDLHPGTPESPSVGSGHTFAIQAGQEPVQLDQLLSSLQANTRSSLQTLIQQFGSAIDQAGPSYDASIQYWLPAFKYTSQVTHDLLGTQPNDLSTFINKGGVTAEAFDHYPVDLQNLISYFDSTAGAFASQHTALAQAVADLPQTLSVATPVFESLNKAFPPLETLSKDLLPGVNGAGPTIEASLPLITQLKDLVQPDQLRGLASDLKNTIPSLAKLTKATIPLMQNQVRPAASCIANVIYPWSQLSINDGVLSGTPGFPVRQVFQEAVDYLPGLAGESRDFDANGPYIRTLLTGGSLTYSLSSGLFGQALEPIESVQPQLPPGGTRPPLHPNTPCETQAPITESELQAKPGPAIKSVSSNLDAPGASLRWKDVVEAAIGQLGDIAGQQGHTINLTSALAQDLDLTTSSLVKTLKLPAAVKVKLP
jgi:phospholipid/cholesterol/gamma-HCH transport system substrate-binding protein